jgi:Raf kinase inhibitor-like YbhB/YbcL family protein
MQLICPDFGDGAVMPRKYAHDGDDVSPPLAWRDVPEGTKSFAVLLDGADRPGGQNHWILFDVYGTIRELPEHIPPQDVLPEWTHEGISVRQGINDFGRVGYTGPLPSTTPPHDNTFTLYALDAQLHTAPQCRKEDILAAMEGHILAQAQLVGIYTA